MYRYYDPAATSPKPGGLNNPGSNCWCNSLLQTMMGCTAITESLQAHPEKYKDNVFAQTYLAEIVKNDNPYISTEIINAFRKQYFAIYSRADTLGQQQECTHEAFVRFIQAFDDSGPRMPISGPVSNLFLIIRECTTVCADGHVCGTVRENTYSFMVNDVAIEKVMLRSQTQITRDCDRCGKNTPHSQQHVLKRLGELVVIFYNKYAGKFLHAGRPDTLTFPGKSGAVHKYILVGQIEHYGSQHGGHYAAYGLRNGEWWYFNDSFAGRQIPAPTEHTYMLFYAMVKN